jgi:hypothetical protein
MPLCVLLSPPTLLVAGVADAAEAPSAVPKAMQLIIKRRFIPGSLRVVLDCRQAARIGRMLRRWRSSRIVAECCINETTISRSISGARE